MDKLGRINEIESRLTALEPKIETNTITPEETTEVRTLVAELETLEAEQRAFDLIKARKQNRAKAAVKGEEEKLVERFSLFKVVRALKANKSLTGVEAEIHEEGLKEARESQVAIGGFALPTFANRLLEQRAPINVGTAASAGNLIATDLYDMVPALRTMPALTALGAQLLTGLSGNIDIPAGDGLATAAFNTETGNAAETVPTTKLVSMTPKRLAAYTDITMQMLAQSSMPLQNWVTSELINAGNRAVDKVGILGGGTNEPVGIFAMAGTQTVAIGTNGGNLTRAHLLALETALENVDADQGTMAYLTTPGVKGFLKNLISSAGVAPFVWQDNNTILGYRAMSNNHVPKTLVKGSSGAICHGVAFGDFSKVLIGNWGAMDITLDNVTLALGGQIRIVINSFWDVQCVHKQGFALIKDALI